MLFSQTTVWLQKRKYTSICSLMFSDFYTVWQIQSLIYFSKLLNHTSLCNKVCSICKFKFDSYKNVFLVNILGMSQLKKLVFCHIIKNIIVAEIPWNIVIIILGAPHLTHLYFQVENHSFKVNYTQSSHKIHCTTHSCVTKHNFIPSSFHGVAPQTSYIKSIS